MLHLIPAPLHRALYRIADRVRRVWWRVRKPQRRSVLIAAFDAHGQVLLARHSYGPPVWALLGGGLGRNEDPERAARREFREELRCDLADLRLVTSVTQADSGSQDRCHLFMARVAGTPMPDMREIVEIGWFDPGNLPANASKWAGPAVQQALKQR
jgi:8-oxo-dGTP pyrophosphatase MutT (NUDIX family)